MVSASTPYATCKLNKPKLLLTSLTSIDAYTINSPSTQVTITQGMMDLLDGPNDELAAVIGHELAHVLKCHFHGSLPSEREADVIGACITRAAGYDEKKAIEGFFKRHPIKTDRAKEFYERVRYVIDNDIKDYCL